MVSYILHDTFSELIKIQYTDRDNYVVYFTDTYCIEMCSARKDIIEDQYAKLYLKITAGISVNLKNFFQC